MICYCKQNLAGILVYATRLLPQINQRKTSGEADCGCKNTKIQICKYTNRKVKNALRLKKDNGQMQHRLIFVTNSVKYAVGPNIQIWPSLRKVGSEAVLTYFPKF